MRPVFFYTWAMMDLYPMAASVKEFCQRRAQSRPIGKVFGVEHDDDGGGEPRKQFEPERIDEFAHFLAVTGKQNQRNHGERQLQTQDDLTQDDEVADGLPLL